MLSVWVVDDLELHRDRELDGTTSQDLQYLIRVGVLDRYEAWADISAAPAPLHHLKVLSLLILLYECGKAAHFVRPANLRCAHART